ncbi:MAG TPA: TonB-dependent receptor, partial [Blastocatellia bacterium]|nr:TonB-dependent receptor [Blastocatellia bacterium]
IVLLFSVFALPAFGQTNKGTIVGSVTDTSGAVVAGATVTVIKIDTNQERAVTTNEDGTYSIPALDIGVYRVRVTAPGFKETIRENITLQIGDRLPVDITIAPEGATEVIEVTGATPIIKTESSDRGNVITGREVTELPISGRNFTLLATLTPGVARASNAGFGGSGPDARQFNNGDPRAGSGGPNASNAQGDTPTARFARSGAGTLTVNGQRPTNNNFSLDGVDNNEPQFGTIGVFPNPDSIAEFRVTTSIPPAEVGRASGAVINVTTQSGSNNFHGSIYYYGQNSALNAFHPILKRDRAIAQARGDAFIPDKAVQQIHEFGATVGGPIFKDKTFFFYDYLGQRNNIPFPFTSTVPTALARQGDFSEFPTITDPRTGQPFPGNRIPASRFDPIAQRILALFPLPTTNVFNPGQFNSNYAAQRENQERINNHGIKIDHRFSGSNALTGRYTEQRLKNVRENFFPTSIIGPPGLPTAGFGAGEEVGNTRQVVITDTHTFSPTLLNEFRFGVTRLNIGINNCGVLGACGVSETWGSDLGIPNVNLGGDETTGGPGIGFTGTGFVEFLGDGGLFRAKSTNPYFADSLTIIKGSHTVKAGGEVRLRYLETICGGCAGFEKGAQGWDGGQGNGTGNALANFLLGLPPGFSQRSKTIGGPFNLRMQEYGFFVQDDWKVNDRLTLNLGLRYDLLPGTTAPTEKDGRISYYFPEERQVLLASDSGDRLVDLDTNNFGPRIGFAYALTDDKDLVLRGGYGLTYTLDGIDYPPAVRNPPFTNIVFDTYTLSQGPPLVTSGIDPANVPTGTNLFSVDREQKNGYVHQFQVSLQYQFARDWSIDVGYVGNRARDLLATFQMGSGGQGIARNAAGELINSVLFYSNDAESSYNGLQVQLLKRFSNNIQGQISYTWSHTIDNATGVFNGIGDSKNQGRQGPSHPFELDFDRGNSVLDIRHLLSANAIIDLPFGKGQPYLSEGVAGAILGGFQVNTLVSGRSGFPFSVVCQCSLIRPSLVGDPFANVPAGRFLNPAAFSTTSGITTVINEAGQPVSFGNLGRNTFRGPSIWNTDLSIFKNAALPFTESTRLQIGIEFFNVFNTTNLTVPNNNVGDVGNDPVRGPTGFGVFDGAYPGRVIQYRLKVLF